MTTIRALIGATLVVACFGVAVAKLPAPPPLTDAQKAAAEEKKAKDAATAEANKQLLVRTEDRVAARYYADMKAKGKSVAPPQMPAGAPAPAPAKAAPKK
ncbi:MAG: formate dehydrogenase [Burkholderiales bacterium]|nr:formate dehydrogenase [Burkholderiales bacterium]MCE7876708.1 formate dehydrogenase [Betaproteobacteria bacterium PRO3]